MLFVLSPAKTLDLTPPPPELSVTQPAFARDAATLARIAKRLRAADLKRLMGVSDKLAELNVARFKSFKPAGSADGVPAALAFAGDVYLGVRARELDPAALDWAQEHLRILSGLYGVLRPLDAIQPYRLEMGIALANPRGEDLYAYWREKVVKALNAAARTHTDRTVVNLASQEYFGAVDRKAMKVPLLTCLFKEREEDGRLRTIAFFAKRARGAMARFAIEQRIDRVEGLKAFDVDGYRFDPQASREGEWTFARAAPHAAAGVDAAAAMV